MWQSISVNCLQPLSMCFIACEKGTYGDKCLGICGNCRHGSSCSNVNGSCTEGCEPGFIEALCKTRELFNFQRLNHYSIHTINTSLGVSTYSKLCFFSLIWSRHYYRWKAANVDLYSVIMSNEYDRCDTGHPLIWSSFRTPDTPRISISGVVCFNDLDYGQDSDA